MAQCRKLEKLVQSQEQILLIKNLKKNSTNMCKPSMAIYSFDKTFFGGIETRVSCHSTAVCSGMEFKFQSWLSGIHYMVMRGHQTVINSHQQVNRNQQKFSRKHSDGYQILIRTLSESHQKVIRKSSESHQTVIRRVIRKSSDSHQTSIKQSSNSHQTANQKDIWKLTECDQIVIRQS